jgi:16S rRNA (guanine527-N7)-methyltransferase
VETLNLANARVERGRAEDYAGRVNADVVTARAVAPMERLVGWCLPLLRPGGVMLALKGDAASDELSGVASGLAALGAAAWSVAEVGSALGTAATRVVRIELGPGGYKAPRSADRRARSTYRPGRRTRG